MRKFWVVLGILIAAPPFDGSAASSAEGSITTLNFAVTRNGEEIGNTTVRLQRKGGQTVAETATRVQVRFGHITVYRYEQRQTEHWVDGRLAALDAVTDDNGSVHKVRAYKNGDKLSVDANGRISEVDPAVIPANLWNASLTRTTIALNTKDGSVIPVSVIDRGKEQLMLQGRPTTAHRYSIKTTIPQEVWYDEQQRLLKVELRGTDGSRIQYQLG